MDGLVEGARRKRSHQRPGPTARAHRQAGPRQAENGDRWALRRGQGRRRRLYAHRGPRSAAGRRAFEGLPDPGGGWGGRGSAGDEIGDVMEPSDHLFRRESGRMVAALTRIFGVQNLALAEDVVQEAFCRATEVWRFRGVPENPSAWLMATAKNCALDVLRRERTARTFAPELGRLLESEWTLAPVIEDAFGPNAIKNDLLRMMFSSCHPQLALEAQVALMLHILCGFSVDEIASALVTSRAAIEKRITRGKKTLSKSKKLFDVTAPAELSSRLPAVDTALYLLFNEGYHGSNAEFAVRIELCQEAMRLTAILLEHPLCATPRTNALAALMCLNAARLPARIDASGNLSSLFDQNRSRWNHQLIGEGMSFLELSAKGSEVSEYHLEAAIASVHA